MDALEVISSFAEDLGENQEVQGRGGAALRIAWRMQQSDCDTGARHAVTACSKSASICGSICRLGREGRCQGDAAC